MELGGCFGDFFSHVPGAGTTDEESETRGEAVVHLKIQGGWGGLSKEEVQVGCLCGMEGGAKSCYFSGAAIPHKRCSSVRHHEFQTGHNMDPGSAEN